MKVKYYMMLMLIPFVGFVFVLKKVPPNLEDMDWFNSDKGIGFILGITVYQMLCFIGLRVVMLNL